MFVNSQIRRAALFVSIAALASACGPSATEVSQRQRIGELEEQLRDANERGTQLEGRLSTLEEQNRNLIERLRSAGQNVEQLETERGTLQSSLDETRRALEELRARERQAQERLATYRGMLDRFRSMIASGRLRVRIVRGRLVVELAESILFDSGDAELKPDGEVALAEVAAVLTTIPNRSFQVSGHTDDRPIRSRRFPSNWELSTARGVNVARYLIARGMDGTRLSAAGYAETQPVISNDTPEGRAQNRRIEIALMPNLDELPDLSALEAPASASTPPAPAQQ